MEVDRRGEGRRLEGEERDGPRYGAGGVGEWGREATWLVER